MLIQDIRPPKIKKLKPIPPAFLILSLILQVLAGVLFLPPIEEAKADGWYDSNWDYRREITIDPVTPVADYQVLVTLTSALGTPSYDNIEADGKDIFFTAADGTTEQKFWVEEWNDGGASKIWVKVTTSEASTIYMYYGNTSASSASNGTNVFELYDVSGIKGFWHLDEDSWNGTSGEVIDETGINNGTAKNEAGTSATGKFNRAGSFDGADDYVDCGNNVSLDITTNEGITMMSWIKLNEFRSQYILGRADELSGYDFWLYDLGSAYAIGMGGSDGTNWWYGGTDALSYDQWQLDKWYHIAITYSPDKYIHIYRDGVSVDEGPLGYNLVSGDLNLLVGDGYNWLFIHGDLDSFKGAIDEVGIYNRALDASEILTIYNNYMEKMGSYYNVRKYVSPEPNATVDSDTIAPAGTVSVDTDLIYEGDLVQVVTVTYNEIMSPGSTPTITFSGNSGAITTQGNGAWSTVTFVNDTWTETFDVADANEETAVVTVSSSLATDAAGNSESACTSDSFAIDTSAPTIDSVALGTDEYVNAVETDSGVNIVINTSGVEDGQAVTCNIKDVGNAHTVGSLTGDIASNAVTIASTTLTTLDDGTITVTCDVSDLAGNPAVQGADTSVKDAVAPSGYTVSIDQGNYINNSNKTSLSFTFAGAEVGATYNYSIDDAVNDPATDPVAGSGAISTAADTISPINVSALNDSTLTLTVYLTDTAGNQGSDTVDTVVKEIILPTVSTLSPTDNAVNVALDTNLVLTFSKNVDSETGDIVIKKSAGDTAAETIDVASEQIGGSNTNTITINPSSDLEYNTEYYVQIAATCFDDAVGNSYASITDTVSWSFTTIAAQTQAPETTDTSLQVASGNTSVNLQNADSLTAITVPVTISSSLSLTTTYGSPSTVAGKKQITTKAQDLTITRNSISLKIPASATITDTDNTWDGQMILPTIQSNVTSNTNLLSDQTINTSLVIQVGLTNKKLSLNKAARLLLPGQAGKRAGWNDGTASQEITNTCGADSQAIGDALPSEGNCKINVGQDLIVWTKHFTQFFTYTSSPIVNGGLPPAAYNPPVPPAQGFSIVINDEDEYTDSRIATLKLQAGSDAKNMALSNFSDFRDSSQIPYQSLKSWTLSEGKGEKTVYVKFYTQYGQPSEIVSDTIILKSKEIGESAIEPVEDEEPIEQITTNRLQQKIIEVLEELISLYSRLILILKR